MKVYTLLLNPGDFQSPQKTFANPELILKGEMSKDHLGDNGIYHISGNYEISEIIEENRTSSIDKMNFDFVFFTKEQRKFIQESKQKFQEKINNIGDFKYNAEEIFKLFPFISVVELEDTLNYYIFNDISRSGGISLKYYSCKNNMADGKSVWETIVGNFHNSKESYNNKRQLLNDTCWYSKWRDEYEMERKYTFKTIPDTWVLINRLYKEVLNGKIKGFVPELDMDFQVFDYESHIYEVLSPEDQKGYISFIPQTDGKMTIKQKWFHENAEIRKETVTWNNNVKLEESAGHAMELCGGEVRKLPVFRRKRFDVNFESLESGNIYGVYFDICRIPDEGYDEAFSQCEVEYCRTRTLQDMKNVTEEFETVCEYTADFLKRNGAEFEHNLYSKLDFVRDAYNAHA